MFLNALLWKSSSLVCIQKKKKKKKQTPKPRDTLIVGDERGEIKSMSEDVIQRNGREWGNSLLDGWIKAEEKQQQRIPSLRAAKGVIIISNIWFAIFWYALDINSYLAFFSLQKDMLIQIANEYLCFMGILYFCIRNYQKN